MSALSPLTMLPGAYTSLGYRAAAVERKSGRPLPQGGSGDYHLRADRELLCRIAEGFDRDNPIYQGLVNRSVDAILGIDGFGLQLKERDESLNRRVEDDWADFAEQPEVRRLFHWQDCERLSLRSVFNDGDVAAIKTKSGKFQFIESELITGGRRASGASRDGGRIEQGVELDPLGAPLAFWIAPRDDNGYVQRAKARRYKEEDCIYAPALRRYSQTRGEPVLTASFSMIHRINDVCDAEAIAWQLLARFALTINRTGGANQAFQESDEDDDGSDAPPDLADRVSDVEAGTFFHGEKGETISAVERTLPGANFPESVRMYLRLIGLPLGLPLEIILLDYSRTNYSSARAALEQAYRFFISWQRWLMRRHHNPAFLWWYRRRLLQGKFKKTAPDRPRFEWVAPEFPWIDQLKEAQAWGLRIDRGLATQGQALRSLALDRNDWLDDREKEIESAIQRADALNKKYPSAQVDWRHFAGVPVSKMQGTFAAIEPGGTPESEKAPAPAGQGVADGQ